MLTRQHAPLDLDQRRKIACGEQRLWKAERSIPQLSITTFF